MPRFSFQKRRFGKPIGANELVKRIQDALGTAEEGEALVEVARNAHRAEQELAAIERKKDIDI